MVVGGDRRSSSLGTVTVDTATVADVQDRPAEGGLRHLAATLRPHLFLIVVCAFLAANAGIGWMNIRGPTYRSTAELVVTPLSSDETRFLGLPLARSLGDPTRTIQTAAALLESREIATSAAGVLGAPWTPISVERAVTVTPKGQTNVVEITATTEGADSAAAVANEYADAALRVRGDLLREAIDEARSRTASELAAARANGQATEALDQRAADLALIGSTGDPTISAAEAASPAEGPEGLPLAVVIALALIGGAMVGVAGAVVLDALRAPRLVRREQLRDLLGVSLLGHVPELRGGRGRQPSSAARDAGVSAAGRALRAWVCSAPGFEHTVFVTSPGRGDGRTTVANELAGELARQGVEVEVADHRSTTAAHRGGAAGAPQASAGSSRRRSPSARWRPTGGRSIPAVADDGPGEEGAHGAGADLLRPLEDGDVATRVVIVDAPPLGELEASAVPSPLDTLVIVGRIGHTTIESILEARDICARSGLEPLGAIALGGR